MLLSVLLLPVSALLLVIAVAVRKKAHYWLPYYVSGRLLHGEKQPSAEPVHILFCVVDHFEPGNGGADKERQEHRIKTWGEKYPEMADRHQDADGKAPQHTWFYPPHHDTRFLKDIVAWCGRGYGEIEMHLHHNHMAPFPDTEDTLRAKILRCRDEYAKLGIFCLPDGTRRFAFIHGDWALANSRGGKFCGVNNEIAILKECGCYADLTFPTLTEAQTAMVNRIYYARSSAARPKSYNRGSEAAVNKQQQGDLLLLPGILGLRWKARKRRFFPAIETSDLDCGDEPFPGRIDYWVNNAVTVKGRPDWRFIKLHTHGAREDTWDSLFGGAADGMYTWLERNYNDGNRYVLHYVAAREMYNIVKAAEAGLTGDPAQYRNYAVPAYIYCKGPAAAAAPAREAI
jgi:hypothetical protein